MLTPKLRLLSAVGVKISENGCKSVKQHKTQPSLKGTDVQQTKS